MSDLINHGEAFELAHYQRENSNVARCYLDHCKTLTAAQARIEALERALADAKRLCDEALPKFNWGASFLDANAIHLLNTVPTTINKAMRDAALGDLTPLRSS